MPSSGADNPQGPNSIQTFMVYFRMHADMYMQNWEASTLIDLNIIAVPVSRKLVRGGYTYDDLPDYMISEAGIIINTTPVGMAPATDEMPPIDYSCLREGQLLFDLIYNPPVTAFLARGEEHGCMTVNGEEMFLIQAQLAWEKWNEEE